jgi:hypothetical protein
VSDGVLKWEVSGDWFDLCKCNVPCPCNFGQAPTYGDCAGILAWHINDGHYGDDVRLDDLNFIMVGSFKGNLWDDTLRDSVAAFFFDERGNEKQREALQMIFMGKAGGFPAEFAKLIGEIRGTEFVPIRFEVAKDLAYWSVDISGKVVGRAEALSGPMIPQGKRVQTMNSPEVMVYTQTGVATWGKTVAHEVDAFGFKWNLAGLSSKHIPFNWSGP